MCRIVLQRILLLGLKPSPTQTKPCGLGTREPGWLWFPVDEAFTLRKSRSCKRRQHTRSGFAVAHFRGPPFGQLLYSGDDLSGPEWNSRGWTSKADVRQHLFELAFEAVLRLE